MGFDQQIEDPKEKLYNTLHNKGYYTKSFDEFKTKYSTPETIDKLYEVVNRDGLYTKTKDDFYSQYYPEPVKKKELGSLLGGMAGNGLSQSNGKVSENGKLAQGLTAGSAFPQATPEQKASFDIEEFNSLLAKRDELNKRKAPEEYNVISYKAGLKEKNPEYDKYKAELADVNSKIEEKNQLVSKHLGIDADIANKVVQDFPNEKNPEALKVRANLIEENPIKYQRLSAAHKNQQKIASVAGNSIANKYNELSNNSGTYFGLTTRLPEQIDIIDKTLSGKDRDRAIENLRVSSAQNINASVPELQQEYEQSGLKEKGITPDQYAGLVTLRYFNPNEYRQAVDALGYEIDANEDFSSIEGHPKMDIYIERRKEGTQSKLLGKEAILKKLMDIGRANKRNYIIEHNYSLNDLYNKSSNDEERAAIVNRAAENANIINDISNDAKEDAVRFPLQHELELGELAKEITQKAGFSAFDYGVERFAKGMNAPTETLENILTNTFFGERANTGLNLRRFGEQIKEHSESQLPSSFGDNTMPFIPKFSQETKDKANKVLSNPALSKDEKQDQIKEILSDAYENGGIEYITNTQYGKLKNFGSKASIYHMAGMVGDVAAFAAQTYMLGAAGAGRIASAGLPMFLDTQNDFYKEAVAKGIPNPGAYANLHASVMFAAGAITPQLDILKKSFGVNTALGKTIQGLDENTWNNIINKNTGILRKIQNSVSAVVNQTGHMAATYGFGTSLASDIVNKGFFGDTKDFGEIMDDAISATKNLVMDSAPLLGLTAFTNFRSVSPQQKAIIWDIGAHPGLAMKEIKGKLESGEITAEQATNRTEFVDNISRLIKQVPVKDKNGKRLTDKSRLNYLWELYREDGISKSPAETKTRREQEELRRIENNRQEIFENKEQPTSDQELLASITSRETVGAAEKGADLQYFIDKAGESPLAAKERFGEATDELIKRVPTEKLQENRDYLAKYSEDSPEVKELDRILAERKSSQEPEKTATPSTGLSRGDVGEEMGGEKLPTVDEVYDILESEESRQGGSWLDNEYGDARFDSEEQARKYAEEVHSFLVGLGQEKEIPVYRAVAADDVDLSPYGIGESWSFSLDAAKEFGKRLGVPLSEVKIISGKVPSENVDWQQAVRQYHNFSDIHSGESEFELPIPANRKIKDIQVDNFKDVKDKSLSPNIPKEGGGLRRGDEKAEKLQEDKDTLLVDGIKNVSKNKQASDLLKIAMNRGVIPERLYNDFGKELAAIKVTPKSKTAVVEVAEVISKYVDAKNEKTDGFIKEQNQAIENADFEKRAYEGMTQQEKFEAVIEDKAQTSEKLTPEELAHVNENYFIPKGYKYNENWDLVKEKKSKSLSPNIPKEGGGLSRGDVEFTAKGGNKLVDDKGEPLTVYHGTDAEGNIDVFKLSEDGGIHFTKDVSITKNFGGKVVKAKISIKNPASYEDIKRLREMGIDDSKDVIAQLKKEGFDGIINDFSLKKHVIAFSPDQIKIEQTPKATEPNIGDKFLFDGKEWEVEQVFSYDETVGASRYDAEKKETIRDMIPFHAMEDQSLSSNTPSKEQGGGEHEAKIQELESERQQKVDEAMKPELPEVKFKTADDIKGMAKGNPKEFKRIAREQGVIKKALKQLENITNCLWP